MLFGLAWLHSGAVHRDGHFHDSMAVHYFLRRKPDYERLNSEVDRAYTPGECDNVLCDGATMYFSSAAHPIDSMRMSAGAT